MTATANRGLWIAVAAVVLSLGGLGLYLLAGASSPAYTDAQRRAQRQAQADEHFKKVESTIADAHRAGKLEVVLGDVHAAISAHPDDPRGYRMLAWCYVQMNRDADAYEQFVLSLKNDPMQPEVELWAGITSFRLNRLDRAVLHFRKAVELAPREAEYHLQLANIHIHRREFKEAETIILRVLQNIDSNSAEAYALLSDIHAKQGDPRQALVQIDRAIERTARADRDKHVKYVLSKAALLRRLGSTSDVEQARLALQSLEDEERYRPEVMESMALCHAMLQEPGKAGDLYADAFFFDPANAQLAVKACRWYLKAGDAANAEKQLRALRRLNSGHPQLIELQGEIDALKTASP